MVAPDLCFGESRELDIVAMTGGYFALRCGVVDSTA